MPRPLPQRALARRALTDDVVGSKRNWVHHGVAVLGISVLGLGVAGSVVMSGSAQSAASPSGTSQHLEVATTNNQATVSKVVQPGVTVPSAFDRRSTKVSRSSSLRPALMAASVGQLADQRAESLLAAREQIQQNAQSKAIETREKSLEKAAGAISKKSKEIKKAKAKAKAEAKAKAKAAAARKADAADGSTGSGSGKAALPVSSGYRIAARFGDTGSWSRYHTGIDFSAAMGTPVHAAASGVVTHAGSGSAGWAGHYVTIKHADGKTSLYAHMSTVSVHEGETVSGGQRVGAIGMTGRTFGPHVHFEVYPRGAKVGDPYTAINPAPWLHARGLRF